MPTKDEVFLYGFMVPVESTESWKQEMIKRGEWKDRVFIHANTVLNTDDYTYQEFYEKFGAKSWEPIYAKVL